MKSVVGLAGGGSVKSVVGLAGGVRSVVGLAGGGGVKSVVVVENMIEMLCHSVCVTYMICRMF